MTRKKICATCKMLSKKLSLMQIALIQRFASSSTSLEKEIKKREEQMNLFEEENLLQILEDVTAALLFMKSLDMAHQDIKPGNIMRSERGLKLLDFGSTWRKGLHSVTRSVNSTPDYMSPEMRRACNYPTLQFRPFESDIFSLGMTLFHLAALKNIEWTFSMDNNQLQTLFREKVDELSYSNELKQLITKMLSVDPKARPTLEDVQKEAKGISRRRNQESQKWDADQLMKQARLSKEEKDFVKAAELFAEANRIYSALPNGIDIANSFREWGKLLGKMKRYEEAVEKFKEAHNYYAILESSKDKALNFNNWGTVLINREQYEEAEEKFAEAAQIYSQEDIDTAFNLKSWGLALRNLRKYNDAEMKHKKADGIYINLCPNSKKKAENQRSWAIALYLLQNYDEAVRKFADAESTFRDYFSEDKARALNFLNWADCLEKKGNDTEAVKYYEKADEIFSDRDKEAAINLLNWGVALDHMEEIVKAIEKYEKAEVIFSCHFLNDKDRALNFLNWGTVLNKVADSTMAEEQYKISIAKKNKEAAVKQFEEQTAEQRRESAVAWCRNKALHKYEKPSTIPLKFPTVREHALNYLHWGDTLERMGKISEAEEKYREAERVSLSNSDDELSALILKNRAIILNKLGRSTEAVVKCQEAEEKFRASDSKEKALNYLNWGDVLDMMENRLVALEKYELAGTIFSKHFQQDKATAINLRNWAIVLNKLGRHEEAERKYVAAEEIFLKNFPNDKERALNFLNWGVTLDLNRKNKDAAEKYESASVIFSLISPCSKDAALNLMNWGVALVKIGKYPEANDRFTEAEIIYKRFTHIDEDKAFHYFNWGNALDNLKKWDQAAQKYAMAYGIYFNLRNKKDNAKNLRNWAIILNKLEDYRGAIAKCEEAELFYSTIDKSHGKVLNKDKALNYMNWGYALYMLGKSPEAVNMYKKANDIFLPLFPKDKETAFNFKNWGIALEKMGEFSDADKMYEKADHILYK